MWRLIYYFAFELLLPVEMLEIIEVDFFVVVIRPLRDSNTLLVFLLFVELSLLILWCTLTYELVEILDPLTLVLVWLLVTLLDCFNGMVSPFFIYGFWNLRSSSVLYLIYYIFHCLELSWPKFSYVLFFSIFFSVCLLNLFIEFWTVFGNSFLLFVMTGFVSKWEFELDKLLSVRSISWCLKFALRELCTLLFAKEPEFVIFDYNVTGCLLWMGVLFFGWTDPLFYLLRRYEEFIRFLVKLQI